MWLNYTTTSCITERGNFYARSSNKFALAAQYLFVKLNVDKTDKINWYLGKYFFQEIENLINKAVKIKIKLLLEAIKQFTLKLWLYLHHKKLYYFDIYTV